MSSSNGWWLSSLVRTGRESSLNGDDHRFELQADWLTRMPHDFAMDRADHVLHAQLDATF